MKLSAIWPTGHGNQQKRVGARSEFTVVEVAGASDKQAECVEPGDCGETNLEYLFQRFI